MILSTTSIVSVSLMMCGCIPALCQSILPFLFGSATSLFLPHTTMAPLFSRSKRSLNFCNSSFQKNISVFRRKKLIFLRFFFEINSNLIEHLNSLQSPVRDLVFEHFAVAGSRDVGEAEIKRYNEDI